MSRAIRSRSAAMAILGATALASLVLASGAQAFHETPAERHHANCTRADVALAAPGTISISVTCHAPRHGDTLGFVFTRGEGESIDTPGIHSFSRHPRLRGPGRITPRARCRRYEHWEFSCSFRANGPISMHGSIKVGPGSACTRPISITTAVTTCDPNRDGVCPADLQVRQLWSGLPAGC